MALFFLSLANVHVPLSQKLVYLGMDIGKNMKETVNLSLELLKKKLRIAYASIAFNIKHIDKLNLAKIYNSLVVPHLLSLCPVWQFFSEPQKLSVRRVYFRYAKFLLSYPPWTRNSYLVNKFRLVSPTSIIDKRLHDFRSSMSIVSHPWSALLI